MKIQNFKKIQSTNKKAKYLATKGAKPWTIIVAEQQNAGYGKSRIRTSSVRGAIKRRWFSPAGGLYFSIVLPKIPLKDLQIITLIAAIAVNKTLNQKFKLNSYLKWPNDILIDSKKVSIPDDRAKLKLNKKPSKKVNSGQGRKVCGILTENIIKGKSATISVIGIGLNTNIEKFPTHLKNKATSLKIELGKNVDNKKLLISIVKQIKNTIV